MRYNFNQPFTFSWVIASLLVFEEELVSCRSVELLAV